MYNDVITLIGYTESTDSYGIVSRTESRTDVFAKLESIGTSEFYQAAASGLKPEIKFIIADYLDYSLEKDVEWEGKRYNVLRTFRKDNTLEITCYGVDES